MHFDIQSSSDLPLLVNIRNLATRLLSSLLTPSSPATPASSTAPTHPPLQSDGSQLRIGFITPPFKDNKIPVTDHLHAHAYIAPADLMGWWRGIAYGPLAWYAIDDLIAEIRCECLFDALTSSLTQTGATESLFQTIGSSLATKTVSRRPLTWYPMPERAQAPRTALRHPNGD
jgi:hypothetical protein